MELPSRAPETAPTSAIGLRVPRVHFLLSFLAPGVERVVHHHAVLQHLVVVLEIARKTEGHRRQAGRLRREIKPRGVGTPYDDRELLERRIGQPVVLEESVEATELPV